MREELSKFDPIPYQNIEGQVVDINAAFVEAEIIDDTMKNKRRIFGLFGPSKAEIAEAEEQVEIVGRTENIKTNERIEEEREVAILTWKSKFDYIMCLVDDYCEGAKEKAEDISVRKARSEELDKIRKTYTNDGKVIEALDKMLPEGISQFKSDLPNLKEKYEAAKAARIKGENAILQSNEIPEILEGLSKAHYWMTELEQIRKSLY